MAGGGIFPTNGLAPGLNNGGIALENPPGAGCSEAYYNEQCAQKVDPKASNAWIAELVSIINACPSVTYNCAQRNNVLLALECMFGAQESKFGFWGIATGISLPAGTWTLVSPSTATGLALRSSTYANGVFTAGVNEGGWYNFAHVAQYTPGSVSDFSALVSKITGPDFEITQHNVQGSGNQGNSACASGPMYLDPGETVTLHGYHLTGSGTLTSIFAGAKL